MNLIPKPKKLCVTYGQLQAGSITAQLGEFATKQVEKALQILSDEISEKNLAGDNVMLSVIKAECLTNPEEYTVEISQNGIRIEACHAKGVFYALQTLRQIICTEGCFPCCEIYDKPDFALRGLQNDTTRGRVPTLEGLKKIADICSYYKLNVIALYFEHSFTFHEFKDIVSPDERLSPEELKEFVAYCKQLYIEVIPYVAMFGHQYRLLQSEKYNHLCELENYTPTLHYWQERMLHHSIDISNPESLALIKSFIDQLTEVFPYEIYIAGIDETFDLCTGRNKDKNMIVEYCSFADEICAYLKEKGKTALIADDIIQKHENGFLIKSDNIVMYHWDYDNQPDENQYKVLCGKELPFIAVPTTWSYNSIVENSVRSSQNIFNTIELGKKYGAAGILNTIWGDRGHWCDFNCTLYGVVMGAAKSWNTECAFDEEFEMAFSQMVFGEKNENITKLLSKLETLTSNANLYWLVRWYSENIINNEKTQLTLIEPDIRPKDNADKALNLLAYTKKIAQRHPEKEEFYESLAATIGICVALNLLSDAIVAKRKLTLEELSSIEENLCQYHRVWLRDNKEGEFYEIRNFVDAIIKYLEK